MKAVVLAAGEGTRLRPFTVSRPKVMIPVGNRPILEYVISALVENGIQDIVLVVGYRKETIMSYFADGKKFGARITYAVQEKQLGTAHALSVARKYLDEDFLVVAGDNLIDSRTISDLVGCKRGPSMLVTESEMPSKYGVVQVEGNKVVRIDEKPEGRIGNIISTGIYCFNRDFLRFVEDGVSGGKIGITHVLQALVPRMDLPAVHTTGKWIDVVYPWDLIGVNAAALTVHGQEIAGTVESGVTIKGSVSVGAGTRIRSGTYIEGPAVIGEGCDIGPSVTILPSTSIGNGVQIASFSLLSNCLIMNNVDIGSHSHLSHSVLDDGVRVATGLASPTGCAFARVEDEFFKLERVGGLVGERTEIGSGVVISPGSIVGAGCRIGSGVRVTGNLENKSVVV
ncbi:MAG: NTP transferase domain-containing protein [Methanomassiliicoccales archaeon]|nr:NTP transferase domain-containing protein [Methanomassiliicoccales archaeon]